MNEESIVLLERALNFNYENLLIEDPVIDIDPWCTLANLNDFCKMCYELEKALGIKLSITERINNVT